LCKGPPRDHWPRKAEVEKIKKARLYWAVRELKRIEVAGGELPPDAKSWLEARISQFADLEGMTTEDGFPECAFRRRRPRCPAHGDHVIRSMTTRAAHELDGAVGCVF
ncbi:MAG TPA: hypothetical protein VGT81_19820, partial [Casimicrobiaceae bacterium]|nr:hypothetical protein [Casimicrobiaceae bacterium]